MKTLLKRIIVVSLVLALSIPMFAMANEIRVVVNGELVDFTGDQAPYIDANGRTLVPVRKVFEKLGSDVVIEYDEPNKMVRLTKGITAVALVINNPTMTIAENGVSWPIKMDTVPVITNGRTMLPARFIAETIGARVGWIPETSTVTIDSDYTVTNGYVGNARLSMVTRDGKFGCIDRSRQVVIPIVYDSIDFREFSSVEKDGQADVYNNAVYAIAKATQNGRVTYFGIVREHTNNKGVPVPARVDEFDYVESVPSNNNYVFVQKNGKWGVLAMSGETAVEISYDEKPDFMTYNGDMRVRVKKGNLYGISDLENNLVAPIQYNMIGKVDFTVKGNPIIFYQEGYVCAMRNVTFGYLDMEGNEIGFQYLDTNPFKNGIAKVNYNGEEREIKINSSGRITLLPKQDNGWD